MDLKEGITRQQEQIEQQEQERQKPSLTLEQIKQQYEITTSSSEVPAMTVLTTTVPVISSHFLQKTIHLARDWLADCGLCALVGSLFRTGPSVRVNKKHIRCLLESLCLTADHQYTQVETL